MICFSKFSFVSTKYKCNLCSGCLCRKCFQHELQLKIGEENIYKKVCNSCYLRFIEFTAKKPNANYEDTISMLKKIQLSAVENLNNPRFYKKI